MTKKQALSELELESLPDFLEIGKMLEDVDGYSEQKKEAAAGKQFLRFYGWCYQIC